MRTVLGPSQQSLASPTRSMLCPDRAQEQKEKGLLTTFPATLPMLQG